jgi:hypothetical protein
VAKKDLDSRQITADVMVGIPAGAIMGIFGLGFVAYTFKQAWQEWILTKRGKIAIAEIESVDKSLFRRIRYRFMSAHGDREATVRLRSKRFRPAEGERIEILYMDAPPKSRPVADLLFVKPVR